MWIGDKFLYTKGLLKKIAKSYGNIYDGLPLSHSEITNPFAIAEFRADFYLALNSIGRGKWDGVISGKFRTYRHLGKLQRIIIADVMGLNDWELEGLGFFDVARLRGYAYYLMCIFLNGGENVAKD